MPTSKLFITYTLEQSFAQYSLAMIAVNKMEVVQKHNMEGNIFQHATITSYL